MRDPNCEFPSEVLQGVVHVFEEQVVGAASAGRVEAGYVCGGGSADYRGGGFEPVQRVPEGGPGVPGHAFRVPIHPGLLSAHPLPHQAPVGL